MSTQPSMIGMFPGQGSQSVGMGKALYEASEIAQSLFEKADAALGFSLSTICFSGPPEKLTSTAIAQPAILTVSTICFEIAKAKFGNISAAAGHSLGEYSALVAAGAISFEDAVLLVHKRGTYMQEAVPVGQGKMLAVLGREVKEIEEVLSTVKTGVAEIANINAPGQIVVAGDVAGIDQFTSNLGSAKTIALPVSAPFHCKLMKPAEEKLTKDLKVLQINTAKFPIYANFSAKPVSGPDEIRECLRLQVCGRVRWVECVQNAINDFSPQTAVEFGAGNVLSGLLKRINPQVERVSVSSLDF